jgi:hypothetical protein
MSFSCQERVVPLADVLDGVGQPIDLFVRLDEKTGVDLNQARVDLLAFGGERASARDLVGASLTSWPSWSLDIVTPRH